MILFDPAEHDAAHCQGMLSQLVVPRPIAMVSTVDEDGVVNVAPFSYYLPLTGHPMLLAVTMGLRATDGGLKHSYENARRTGDFVVNLTTVSMFDHIETAAIEFPRGVSELDNVPWTAVASRRVASPSIAESPAHLECRIHREVAFGETGVPCSEVHLMVGEVVCVTLDESICTPDGAVDPAALEPVGRLGLPWFTTVGRSSMVELARYSHEEFLERQAGAT